MPNSRARDDASGLDAHNANGVPDQGNLDRGDGSSPLNADEHGCSDSVTDVGPSAFDVADGGKTVVDSVTEVLDDVEKQVYILSLRIVAAFMLKNYVLSRNRIL